mgnify:CR=1 FL=1
MLRSISLSLSLGGAAALALANTPLLPVAAQEADAAEDLGGVMSISLKDVVQPTIGFQGALQGAGTPNQAGIGGFLPISVGEKGKYANTNGVGISNATNLKWLWDELSSIRDAAVYPRVPFPPDTAMHSTEFQATICLTIKHHLILIISAWLDHIF